MATAPGTALAPFNPQAGAPAHVAHFFDDAGTNIAPRTTVPSLSPEGKTWTISLNGQKTKLQRRNADGDLEPLPIMKAVILDYNKQRGRAYYEGSYDPANASAPICWSDDGVTPDDSLPGPFAAGTQVEPGSSRKISAACANCPMAVKGSKTTDNGKAVTACAQHRMLAVVPDPALGLKDIPPLRLKIAMTSDWDKQSPDQEAQGWLAFSPYMDWLLARGVKHSAALVTKMKFDPMAAYPKIFFAAERYLEADELATIGPMVTSPDTTKLLGGTWTPAGVDGVPKDQQQVAGAAPAQEQLNPPPSDEPVYEMAAGETHTREQYHAAGWTDAQLLQAGKMVSTAPVKPAAPAAPAAPPAPPLAEPAPATAEAIVLETAAAPSPAAAAPAAAQAIVIDEPAGNAAAVVAETTATVVAASPPAADPAPPSSPAVVAEAAPPVQEPAQAVEPPPPAPAVPEPPAAAAAAAAVAPAVSTDVDPALASLLDEWK
jgi:hypothetical protein